MRLIRRDKSFTANPDDPNDYSQVEHCFVKDQLEERIRVEFPDFGRGKKRRPGFAVELEWIDVRNYLMAFIEMGEMDAQYIHSLMKLAEAVEGAGWTPNGPPTQELAEAMDALPQSN